MHLAAEKGHFALVSILLEHGADPSALDRNRQYARSLPLTTGRLLRSIVSPSDVLKAFTQKAAWPSSSTVPALAPALALPGVGAMGEGCSCPS